MSAPEEADNETDEQASHDIANLKLQGTTGDASGRRHLSVKERKLLKKQGTGQDLNSTTDDTARLETADTDGATGTNDAVVAAPSSETSNGTVEEDSGALTAAGPDQASAGHTSSSTHLQQNGAQQSADGSQHAEAAQSLEAARKAEKQRREAKAAGGGKAAKGAGQGKPQQQPPAPQQQQQQQVCHCNTLLAECCKLH